MLIKDSIEGELGWSGTISFFINTFYRSLFILFFSRVTSQTSQSEVSASGVIIHFHEIVNIWIMPKQAQPLGVFEVSLALTLIAWCTYMLEL